MPKTRVTCPECAATLALGPSVPAGKRIKCPKCDAVFPVSVSTAGPAAAGETVGPMAKTRRQDSTPPRRRRPKRKKQGKAVEVVAVVVASSVLLAALGAGGWYMFSKPPDPTLPVLAPPNGT